MNGMEKINANNLRFFILKEILVKYSDDDHPLNSSKIIKIMKENYGIDCDRKTVYRDIKSLIHFGFDINKAEDKRLGVYLGERKYELVEIRMLIDAILTAKSITPKKTRKLVNKLYDELSIYQSEDLKNQVYIDSKCKIDNEEVYYTIDKINDAIAKRKKIKFLYKHKTLRNNNIKITDGKVFVVSPYALIWSADRYYLVANDENYNDISNYRIDRMSKVEVVDEGRRSLNEVSDYDNEFDVSDYAKKNINMFPGEKVRVEMVCQSEFLEVISEKFGKDINCKRSDRDEFTVTVDVYMSDALIDWLVSNACFVLVKSPLQVFERVCQKIKMINNIYFPVLNVIDKML